MEVVLSIDPGWELGWAAFSGYDLLEHGVMNFQRDLGEGGRYRALWDHLCDLKLRLLLR